MKCLNCRSNFIINRNINTLFSREKYFLCNKCYKRYPINISAENIPINNQLVIVYTLFKEFYYLKTEAFILEFSQLFNYIYANNKSAFILVTDRVNINEYLLNKLEIISTLFAKNIIIISFYQKN